MRFAKKVIGVGLVFKYVTGPNAIKRRVEGVLVVIRDDLGSMAGLLLEVDRDTEVDRSNILTACFEDISVLSCSAPDIENRLKIAVIDQRLERASGQNVFVAAFGLDC